MSDGTMTRGYLVETWSLAGNQLHHTLIGGDGAVLRVQKRTATDSYNVFAIDPGKSPQVVANGPGTGNDESPIGWLSGRSEKNTNITGNNVSAYLDADNNNRADSGGTRVSSGNFLTSASLGTSPTTTSNKAVAVQNLFYLNNVIHDILYRHGFDETAGNFQVDNFAKGGAGNDPVRAEAQDGSGTNNANFSTPPDGRKPRMQMYLWTGAGFTHELVVTSPTSVTYGAMGAQFGPALNTTGLGGSIAVTTPADGCTAISTALAGKVALIDRGSCDFNLKVANAQAAGAIGAVIANNQGGNVAFPMGGTNPAVTIPSVMISQNDGIALKGLAAPAGTMRLNPVQPPQIDASLDSDVVYHEYGHGLTWRMIGDMGGTLSGALGEGASDSLAMLVNGDDRVGEYSASNPVGIRRFPYANYPLTYADVNGASVHSDGEIYAAIIWRLMDLFGPSNRAKLLDYFVDGMNFIPADPAYEDMRDGMLQSVANGSAPGDRCTVWSAFAQFGVGEGASGNAGPGGVTIVPSFTVPADCTP
jgi:extracellular elastinolytic metalloproteinase